MSRPSHDETPPPKPKPGTDDEETSSYDPGRDIGSIRALVPAVVFGMLDVVLVSVTRGWQTGGATDLVPAGLMAVVADQALLLGLMYQGSAASLARSIGGSRESGRPGIVMLLFAAALGIFVLVSRPYLGLAIAGGVFGGLVLGLFGFGLRPLEDVPPRARRFSLMGLFLGVTAAAVLMVGFQFTLTHVDLRQINVFRITLVPVLALATLGLASLAANWSWVTWAAVAGVAVISLAALLNSPEAALRVPLALSAGLAIASLNALPFLLTGWRIYRKRYHG